MKKYYLYLILFLALTTVNAQEITNQYDEKNRLARTTSEDGSYIAYTYDETDNLVSTELFKSAALPLELLSFTATAEQDAIITKWTSVQEINLDRYDILRADDKHPSAFVKVGSIKANNRTEESKYSFIDKEVKRGFTYYYKLQMIDLDGSFEYSNIVSAILPIESGISVYPNPNNGRFTISFQDIEDIQKATVVDASGRIIQEIKELNPEIFIDLKNNVSGVYYIQFFNKKGELVESKEVVKQ